MSNPSTILRGPKFRNVSTHSDDLLHSVNCQAMVNELKQHLITIYSDIQCHDNAKSYIGMAITRSPDLSQIYIPQKGLASRIISDFLRDDFPSAIFPASSHLFNHVPDDKPFFHFTQLKTDACVY